jgi:hypothetical protein
MSMRAVGRSADTAPGMATLRTMGLGESFAVDNLGEALFPTRFALARRLPAKVLMCNDNLIGSRDMPPAHIVLP